jgi:hypothetical protein
MCKYVELYDTKQCVCLCVFVCACVGGGGGGLEQIKHIKKLVCKYVELLRHHSIERISPKSSIYWVLKHQHTQSHPLLGPIQWIAVPQSP